MADEKLLLPDFFELFAIRIFDWFINQLIKQKDYALLCATNLRIRQ
jgi:hypothetical protein